MSTLGHSGHSGGHGGHAGGHHGHSGGGHVSGGGGPQETWNAASQETSFYGDLYRSPLIPLIAFGMVFFSVVLVVCLADSNLLEFAVSQHKEAQQKHAAQVQNAIKDAEEASAAQTAEQSPPQPEAAVATPPQTSAPQETGSAPQQGFGQMGAAQQMNAQPSALAQLGYLQQSLQPGFAQRGYAASQQQPYAAYHEPLMAAPGFAPQVNPQAGFGAGAYQPGGFTTPAANQSQHGGAWLQGGYKTGPDGFSRIPMNRMVVNR